MVQLNIKLSSHVDSLSRKIISFAALHQQAFDFPKTNQVNETRLSYLEARHSAVTKILVASLSSTPERKGLFGSDFEGFQDELSRQLMGTNVDTENTTRMIINMENMKSENQVFHRTEFRVAKCFKIFLELH